MNLENLYGFIFWYNPYEKLWYAIDRDTQLEFFNGKRENSIFHKSKEIETLISILTKEGLLESLNK